jgi:hypothetical protein
MTWFANVCSFAGPGVRGDLPATLEAQRPALAALSLYFIAFDLVVKMGKPWRAFESLPFDSDT